MMPPRPAVGAEGNATIVACLLTRKVRGEAALPRLLPAHARCAIGLTRLPAVLSRLTPLKSFLPRVLALLAGLRGIAALLALLLPGGALLLPLLPGLRRVAPLLALRLRGLLPGGAGFVALCVGALDLRGVLPMLPRLPCGGAVGMHRSCTSGVRAPGRMRPGDVSRRCARPGDMACRRTRRRMSYGGAWRMMSCGARVPAAIGVTRRGVSRLNESGRHHDSGRGEDLFDH
jgi:hypothetical protein